MFVVILTRTILSFGLDFRIPISKVNNTLRLHPLHLIVLQLDENMKRAVKRDAVNKETFHFRKSIIPGEFKSQNNDKLYMTLSIDVR